MAQTNEMCSCGLIDESFAEKTNPRNDSVRLLVGIVEKMDLRPLMRAYNVRGRKPGSRPSRHVKGVAFRNMHGSSGSEGGWYPSVGFADSSLYTREPQTGAAPNSSTAQSSTDKTFLIVLDIFIPPK